VTEVVGDNIAFFVRRFRVNIVESEHKKVSTIMDGAYKIKVKQGATIVFLVTGFPMWKSNNSFYNKCSFV
jgi:hypothetical protein